jgi:hypothetical protein
LLRHARAVLSIKIPALANESPILDVENLARSVAAFAGEVDLYLSLMKSSPGTAVIILTQTPKRTK